MRRKTAVSDFHAPFHISFSEALSRLSSASKDESFKGEFFIDLFRRGTLRVELYAPPDPDPQQPHAQDEIYIVAEGSGEFWVEGLPAPIPFQERDFLFVPAGKAHRFVNFKNLKVWVLFYGAQGGERA